MSVTTVAIDGSRVHVNAPGHDIGSGITSRCVVGFAQTRIELESGDLTFRDDVLSYLEGYLVDAFEMNGATVRTGLGGRPPEVPSADYDVHGGLALDFEPPTEHSLRYRVAFYESHGRCIKVTGRGASNEELLTVFDKVQVEAGVDGIWISPPQGAPARIVDDEYPTVVNVPVEGLGLLVIRALTAREDSNLPRWAGSPVVGGAAWVEPGEDFSTTTYLIANETAVGRLLPAHSVVTQGDVEAAVELVEFSWSGS